MKEIDVFKNVMLDLVPAARSEIEQLAKLSAPEDPGVTLIAAAIGDAIAENFDGNTSNPEIFAQIEASLEQGSDSLKDAICTGLIEALIHHCDYHPGKWDRMYPFLGPKSAEYANAWIKFTETGET